MKEKYLGGGLCGLVRYSDAFEPGNPLNKRWFFEYLSSGIDGKMDRNTDDVYAAKFPASFPNHMFVCNYTAENGRARTFVRTQMQLNEALGTTKSCSGGSHMHITISTTVNAPIERVWAAWITPADIVKWNCASAGT